MVKPNPNNGVFTIQFYQTSTQDVDLRVLDINGKLLYKLQHPNFRGSFSQTINLGVVSAGVYVLQLQVGSNKYVRKIAVY
ncbi:MAG: T9SS type A sorting domain-containing protein [Puia sp.]